MMFCFDHRYNWDVIMCPFAYAILLFNVNIYKCQEAQNTSV